jgi:hypothetical protein
MIDKESLIQARDDMLAVLDEKLKDLPEWRAFRIMDKAILAMNSDPSPPPDGQVPRRPLSERVAATATNGADEMSPLARYRARQSYVDLALEFIQKLNHPASTTELVSHIAGVRGRDPGEIRVNIQSSLSKDERIKSVTWSRGRGWWFPNREVPK